MRTATISQAAEDMLAVCDLEQQQPELSMEAVNTQGILAGLSFLGSVRVMSNQRDDSGEKKNRDQWSPSLVSDDETDWSTNDPTHYSESDLLSEYETASNSPDPEDYDWRDAEVEPDEFHEDFPPAHQIDVHTDGKVSRETRAFQSAMDLGLRYEWDRRGIDLLTFVFEENGWSATKRSLDREMEEGMSPDELSMALQLRQVWSANPEFASVFLRSGYYGDRSISVVHRNTTLSWPTALKIVRAFDSVLDEAEMESLLLEFYDEWMSDWSLKKRFRSFAKYLLHCLGLAQGSLDAIPGWAFEEFDE